MLVSDDLSSLAKVKFWITQSRDKARYYQHSELGFNYRMSNILAGIGRGQLKVLNERIEKKKRIFMNYYEAFKSIDELKMMPICSYGQPNYWLSCMKIEDGTKITPLDIIMLLEQNNIESRPIWKPMHMPVSYTHLDVYKRQDIIVTKKWLMHG